MDAFMLVWTVVNNQHRRRRGEEELTEEGVRSAVGQQELDRLRAP
jgi:hypothetical protein